jgi:cytochrome c oxidase accessory protein FixG
MTRSAANRAARADAGRPQAEVGLGDCIDCGLCVQVCPTGIDIRDGLQYQCIGCAACIDVCDDVMDKMNYPRGLIRYSTERALEHKQYRLLRPRIIIYTVILLALCIAFVTSLATTEPAILDVIRDRNTLYRDVGTRGIQNNYTIRVVNKQNQERDYELRVSGIEGIAIESTTRFTVGPESVHSLPVSVIVPHEQATGGQKIDFELVSTDGSDIRIVEESRFRGPLESP